MGRVRAGAFSGVVVFGAAAALMMPNCAAATQIIIDVETQDALCDQIVVDVFISKPEDIDKQASPRLEERACEEGSTRVGTLTVTPSGAKDATVGIRFLAAVRGKSIEECRRTDASGKITWGGENCIVATREAVFAPGQTNPLTVVLTAECAGVVCPDGKECNFGKCVKPDQLQPDGGNQPLKDGQAYDDATPGEGGQIDDGGGDACALCKGANGGPSECSGATKLCSVNCGVVDCRNNLVCSGELNCMINCPKDGDCDQTRCATSGFCQLTCNGNGGTHCRNVDIKASTGSVGCSGSQNACDGVTITADSGTVNCGPGPADKPTCDNVTCNGGTCVRTCSVEGRACGPKTNCAGDCTNWEDAGDGGQ